METCSVDARRPLPRVSSFLYDSASCPLSLDSVLVEDALVRHNFNGVSCYSFRGVARQRH